MSLVLAGCIQKMTTLLKVLGEVECGKDRGIIETEGTVMLFGSSKNW